MLNEEDEHKSILEDNSEALIKVEGFDQTQE